MKAPLFRRVEVWRPLSEERALRYNCIQDIKTGGYRVCTADFVEPGGALDADQARYFVEALMTWDPDDEEQPEWFPTVEAAIAAHDEDFGN